METMTSDKSKFLAKQFMQTNGLDWTVSHRPLFFQSKDGSMVRAGNKSAIVRDDNDKPLGLLTDRYEITQNSEIIEVMFEITSHLPVKVTKGGALQGGKKIFLQLEAGTIEIGEDTVTKYITGIDSHDGSTALMVGASDKVMSCSNQFWRFYNHLKSSGLKMMHRSNVRELLYNFERIIQIITPHEQKHYENYKRFADRKITTDVAIKMLYDIQKVEQLPREQFAEKYSPRRANIMQEMEQVMIAELNAKGKTLWGAFNGVTYYTNHHISKKGVVTQEDRVAFGNGFKLNQRAYEYALELV